ncbi:Translocation protein [Lachnellula occidentalis]|uniref:Translocation protein n=1 Tax=Lachnellula occidentalis TaxID=215460 RepID=A0A8H8S8R9_9HELO|nr:Translocation protein [Lachnellula occidentalis]
MFGVDWWGSPFPLPTSQFFLALSSHSPPCQGNGEQVTKSANLAPWFPPHMQRNIYLSLLHLEPEDSKEKSPAVPQSIIRAALLRRAVEDIHRIIQIRSAKQACSTLLQRGSVGDDLWQRFERAEKEMEEELRDVVTEANALTPNWGQTIFQSANEIAAGTLLRKKLEDIQSQAPAEKEWWERRRASIKSEFMKELDTPGKGGSDEDAVLVNGANNTGSIKKKGRK